VHVRVRTRQEVRNISRLCGHPEQQALAQAPRASSMMVLMVRAHRPHRRCNRDSRRSAWPLRGRCSEAFDGVYGHRRRGGRCRNKQS